MTANFNLIRIDNGNTQDSFHPPPSSSQTYQLSRSPDGKVSLVSLVTIKRSALISSSMLELYAGNTVEPLPVLSELVCAILKMWKFRECFRF